MRQVDGNKRKKGRGGDEKWKKFSYEVERSYDETRNIVAQSTFKDDIVAVRK